MLAALFFVQNVCWAHASQTSLWAERSSYRHTKSTQFAAVVDASTLPALSALTLHPRDAQQIPASTPISSSPPDQIAATVAAHAAVQERFVSSDPDSPIIIQIQDIHEHAEAQRNIAGVIKDLASATSLRLIGLEGAEGPFALEPYRSYPNKPAVAALADMLMALGYLSGPEAAALSATKSPELWGVEQNGLYRKNVASVVRSKTFAAQNEQFISDARAFLARVKAKTYSTDLAALDRHRDAYDRGALGLGGYVKILMATWLRVDGRSAEFPGLDLFLTASDQEKKISFARAEQQRNALVARLSQRLPASALQELVRQSAAARAARLPLGDFYRAVERVCAQNAVALSQFPDFQAYVRYLFLCEKIQRVPLLTEVDELERRVFARTARTDAERMLVQLSDDAVLLRKLIRHEMTSDEWTRNAGRLDDLRRWTARARRVADAGAAIPTLDPTALRPAEMFCASAFERNQAMVDNLLAKLTSSQQKSAALVAGGFHTAGLTAVLRRKNISFVVLTPKITSAAGPNGDYLDVFTRDPTPIEKAFAGQPIYLASERLLSTAASRPNALPSTLRREATLQKLFAIAEPALELRFINAQPNTPSQSALQSAWATLQPAVESLATRFPAIERLSLSLGTSSARSVEVTARLVQKKGPPIFLKIVAAIRGNADAVAKEYRGRPFIAKLDGDDTTLFIFDDTAAVSRWWRIAVANPIWETALHAVLAMAISADFSATALALLSAVAAGTAIAHALINRDARFGSLLQWFATSAFFTGSFVFLSGPTALALNLGVHIPWNALFLARSAPGVPTRLVPLSLLRGPANPTEDPAILAQKLDRITAASRALVFTENTDALDAHLREKINSPYLLLRLSNQDDLLRVSKTVSIDDAGTQHVDDEGPLIKIIQNGGTLVIDYAHSNPNIVEQFNSLFDKRAYFGPHVAHPDLKIIGVVDKATESRYAVSFYRRFDEKVEIGALPYNDPASRVELIDDNRSIDGALRVELFNDPNFEPLLVSDVYVDDKIKIAKKALIEAIEDPAHPRPLILSGALWGENSRLTAFVRRILTEGQVEFNGRMLPVPPGLKLYRTEPNYSRGVENKRIIAPDESTLTGDTWVINRETMGLLFNQTIVVEDEADKGQRRGKLSRRKGLLTDDQPKLKLRVTDVLPDHIWNHIMHSGKDIEIEIQPGLRIPNAYRAYQSAASKRTRPPADPVTLEQARDQRVVAIEGPDLAFIRARVEEVTGEQPFVYNVTADTTLDQLFESLEMGTHDGELGFSSEKQPTLAALDHGRTVIINGLESNDRLARQLETVLGADPYVVVNGQRVQLNKGRLILTSRRPLPLFAHAAAHVRLEPTEDDLHRILSKEIGERFNDDDFNRIMRLEKIFQSVPDAGIRQHELMKLEKSHNTWRRQFPGLSPKQRERLYPTPAHFSLGRLRLLYKYDSLLEGVEDVFMADYKDDPEITAYLRTMTRLTLDREEPGRAPNTIAGRKLLRVLDRTMDPGEWKIYFWQLADTLSLDLLKSMSLQNGFDANRSDSVNTLIAQALVRHDAPVIDFKTKIGEPTPEQMQAKAIRLLKKGIPLMFVGSPGTGKSHMAKQISDVLAAEGVKALPPLTVGPDTKEHDVWRRRVKENGRTEWQDQRAAQWAHEPGAALLVVDEANLVNPSLWNFIGDPDPRKALVFTGNQRTVDGRNDVDFIQEHMVTLRFEPFDKEALKDLINRNSPLRHKEKAPQLLEMLLSLHELFETLAPDRGLSLRDTQELAARASLIPDAGWTPEQVAGVAWRQYRGLFNPNDREALRFIIAKKFGVDVKKLEDDEMARFPESRKKQFWETDRDELVVTKSVALMVSTIDDSLNMREQRIAHPDMMEGKRGVIFEGPSGRGKDLPLIAALKSRGFFDAKTAPASIPATKRYYHLTASVADPEYMLATIRAAREQGSVVIISEMNLLSTAFLEGKLNDLLTDKPQNEGFFLFATINSVDFSGRNRLSTALQNRVVYSQEPDYTESELREIAQTVADHKKIPLSQKQLTYLVKAHIWIRSHIANPAQHPTTPDLLRALEAFGRTKSMQQAIADAYGLIFIKRFLNGASLPPAAALAAIPEEKSVNNLEMIPRIYAGLMPAGTPELVIHTDVDDQNAGYHQPGTGISLAPHAWTTDAWQETFFHESSHGLFTRNIAGLTPAASDDINQLYQDLEDVRHLRAFDSYFPWSGAGAAQPLELAFAHMVKHLDVERFAQWSQAAEEHLTPRKMFQFALVVYAKGLLGDKAPAEKYLENMARLLDDNIVPPNNNPLRKAISHLDAAQTYAQAIPRQRGERELDLQQQRALTALETMRADFTGLPADFKQSAKKTSAKDREKIRAKTAEDVNRRDLAPTIETPGHAQLTDGEMPANIDDVIRRKKAALARKHLHLPEFEMGNKNRLRSISRAMIVIGIIAMMTVSGIFSSAFFEWAMSFMPTPTPLPAPMAMPEQHPTFHVPSLSIWGLAIAMATIGALWVLRHQRISQRLNAGATKIILAVLPTALRDWIIKRFGFQSSTVHSAQEDGDADPLALNPKADVPSLDPARHHATKFDARMRNISETYAADLDAVIADFILYELEADVDHDTQGFVFDLFHFLFVDSSKPYWRAQAHYKKTLRDVVIMGEVKTDNLALNELIRYMSAAGLNVHLSRALTPEEQRQVATGRPTKFITADDLQRRVDAIYLHGAYRQSSGQTEPMATTPDQSTPAPSELSFEEQLARAKKFITDSGYTVNARTLEFDADREIIHIHIWASGDITDLTLLTGLTRLHTLMLPKVSTIDLTPLNTLSGLHTLTFSMPILSKVSKVSVAGLKELEVFECEGPVDLSSFRDLDNIKDVVINFPLVVSPDLRPFFGKRNLRGLMLHHVDVNEEQVNHLLLQSRPDFVLRYKYDTNDKLTELKHADTIPVKKTFAEKWHALLTHVWPTQRGGAPLTFEQQIEAAQKFLDDNKFDRSRLIINDNNTFTLNLQYTQINDLEPLRFFTALSNLDLSDTSIKNIGPLRNLKIQVLNLSGNKALKDFGVLSSLKELEVLGATRTTFSKFKLLYQLPHLRAVEIFTGEPIAKREIANLFANNKSLQYFFHSFDRTYQRADFQMSIDEQIQAARTFLAENGINVTMHNEKDPYIVRDDNAVAIVKRNYDAGSFELFINGPLPTIEPFRQFTSLRKLTLLNTGITDIEPLRGLNIINLEISYAGQNLQVLNSLSTLNSLTLERSGTTALDAAEIHRLFRDNASLERIYEVFENGMHTHLRKHFTGKTTVTDPKPGDPMLELLIKNAVDAQAAMETVERRLETEGIPIVGAGLLLPMVVSLSGVLILMVAPLLVSAELLRRIVKALRQHIAASLVAPQAATPDGGLLFPDVRPVRLDMRVDPKTLSRAPALDEMSDAQFFAAMDRLARRHDAASKPQVDVQRQELHALFARLSGRPEARIRDLIGSGTNLYNEVRRDAAITRTSRVTFDRALQKNQAVVIDLSALIHGSPGDAAFANVRTHLKILEQALAANPASTSELILLAHDYGEASESARKTIEGFVKNAGAKTHAAARLVENDARIFQSGKILIGGVRAAFFQNDPSRVFSLYASDERVFADLADQQTHVLLLLMLPAGLVRVSAMMEKEINTQVFLAVQA
jgi:Leucine-rich repeat (LRR) protein